MQTHLDMVNFFTIARALSASTAIEIDPLGPGGVLWGGSLNDLAGTSVAPRYARSLVLGSIPRLISRRWARASSRASAIPVSGKSPSAIRGRFPRHRKRKSQRFVPVGPTRRMRPVTAGSTTSNSSPVGASAESCAADILADTRLLRGMAHGPLVIRPCGPVCGPTCGPVVDPLPRDAPQRSATCHDASHID